MFNESLQIIRSNADIINSISGVAFGFGTLAVAIWVAYFSPQALQSKIEKKKYLREKRKEHYERLDQVFFKPLSKHLFSPRDNASTSGMDSLKLNLIPVDKNHLKMGISHLESDFPGHYIDFMNFQEDVVKYNSSLLAFYEKPDIKIRTEFNGIFELSDNYILEQDFYILGVKPVKEIILILISRKLNKISSYDKKLIQEVCKTAILSDLEQNANISFPGKNGKPGKTPFEIFNLSVTNFRLGWHPLANSDEERFQVWEFKEMNDEKKQLIIDHICEIVSNEEFFKIYNPVLDMREQLFEKGEKISNQIKQISKLINDGDYETITKCCTDKKIL